MRLSLASVPKDAQVGQTDVVKEWLPATSQGLRRSDRCTVFFSQMLPNGMKI